MIHFWFKHKFIEVGESFKIKTDKEYEYICKSFRTEESFKLSTGIYKPDLIVETECGQEIIFEMANTNKKKVQDYIDKWIELDKTVVEVDIKSLTNGIKDKVSNALYYKGKCFNFNKRDGGYYNTIGKIKEDMLSNGEYDIEFVKKLDWFWNTVQKYKQGIIDDEELVLSVDVLNEDTILKIEEIMGRKRCVDIVRPYFTFKSTKLYYDCLNILNKKKIIDLIDIETDYGIDYYGFRYSWYGIKIKKKNDRYNEFEYIKNVNQLNTFISKIIQGE